MAWVHIGPYLQKKKSLLTQTTYSMDVINQKERVDGRIIVDGIISGWNIMRYRLRYTFMQGLLCVSKLSLDWGNMG